MGLGELFARGSAQRPAQERAPRLVIWCTWNITHGHTPKPELLRGQELLQTICTPCYNKHQSGRKTT